MAVFGGILGMMGLVWAVAMMEGQDVRRLALLDSDWGGVVWGGVAGHPHDEPPAGGRVKIEVRDGYRYITSNGVPDHATGTFPGRGNPNSIKAQDYTFRMTMEPKASDKPALLQPERGGGGRPTLMGVALNGVVFDPGTAEWWHNDRTSGWHYEAIGPGPDLGIDQNHAHVQPNGAYHYHAVPTGLVDKLAGKEAGKAMVLIGWAADGFPIYARWGHDKAADCKSIVRTLKSSYRLKPGDRPKNGPEGKHDGTYEQDYEFVKGSGDLDEFNGRTGVTPEFPAGTYYYVATDEYPNLARSLRGAPDESFRKQPPGHGERPGRGDEHPPPPRLPPPPPPPRDRSKSDPK